VHSPFPAGSDLHHREECESLSAEYWCKRGPSAQSRFGFRVALGTCSLQTAKEEDVLAIAGTGYGVIGILVIILLVVLILYFVRRA